MVPKRIRYKGRIYVVAYSPGKLLMTDASGMAAAMLKELAQGVPVLRALRKKKRDEDAEAKKEELLKMLDAAKGYLEKV